MGLAQKPTTTSNTTKSPHPLVTALGHQEPIISLLFFPVSHSAPRSPRFSLDKHLRPKGASIRLVAVDLRDCWRLASIFHKRRNCSNLLCFWVFWVFVFFFVGVVVVCVFLFLFFVCLYLSSLPRILKSAVLKSCGFSCLFL